MKIYISGRITGLHPDVARRLFAEAAERLQKQGWDPCNPYDNGLPADAQWERHLARDIVTLYSCRAIYMLRGWGESRGARLEHAIAQELRLRVIYESEML